jgi:hypothetical protein
MSGSCLAPSRAIEGSEPSRRIDLGFIHQQNWNVIADGVNPAALGAFQAFAISLHSQRLLADRANQNIQQILRNHERIVLQWA